MTRLISWTGWTEGDWREFLSRFNPMNIFTWTGWSVDDWIEAAQKSVKFIGAGLFGFLVLWLIAYFG